MFSRLVLLLLDVLCLLGVLWCGALTVALLTGRPPVPTGVAVAVAVAPVLPGLVAGAFGVGGRTLAAASAARARRSPAALIR